MEEGEKLGMFEPHKFLDSALPTLYSAIYQPYTLNYQQWHRYI